MPFRNYLSGNHFLYICIYNFWLVKKMLFYDYYFEAVSLILSLLFMSALVQF